MFLHTRANEKLKYWLFIASIVCSPFALHPRNANGEQTIDAINNRLLIETAALKVRGTEV